MLISRLCGHCQVNRLSSANYEATDFELYKELVVGELEFKDATSEVLTGLISDIEDSEVQIDEETDRTTERGEELPTIEQTQLIHYAYKSLSLPPFTDIIKGW